MSLDGMLVSHFEYLKVQALLAYLAVEADHPHRRETVAEMFWPDQPDQVARTNLRQALSKLRKIIQEDSADPPHLIVTPETLQFNATSQYELDVATFSSLMVDCEKHAHQQISTCSECAPRLLQAVMLYRGKFLEQIVVDDSPEFEEWTILKRESLQRKVLDALHDLTEYYEHQPNYDTAQRYAWRQIELDPYREEAHRQLMRVLALSGDRNAALAQYELCCQLLAKELDVEPDKETVALYEQIRNGEIAAPRMSTKVVDSLPYQATPFVGREAELSVMTQLLVDRDTRLVTILGPGGMGKTRLALETAAAHRSEFADGVCFVPLASLTNPDLLSSAIADAVGLQFYPGDGPKQQLLNFFREKSMLVILDNFEQLLMGATLVADILGMASGVKVVVTSRERLNLQEETLVRIEGMDVPASETSEGAAEYGAVRLFLQSARRVQPSFALITEHLPYVVSICRQVEGMPLGILLAAAWVDHISLAEISREIEHSLDFLETEQRDVPKRQRSIRAAFDSSWKMLNEQVVFSQLAIFRGGFSREAAQAVAGATLKTLVALTNKSFIRRDPNGRYTIHELMRQYAESKLGEVPSAIRGVRDRHCAYFADFMKRQEARLKGAEQLDAIHDIEADFDNIRVAWNYAAEQMNVDALDKSWQSLFLLGVYKEQSHEQQIALGKAIDCLRMEVPAGRRGVLFSCFLSLQLFGSDKPHPQILFQAHESQALLRQLDAPFELAFALLFSPATSAEERMQNVQESLDIFKGLRDPWGIGRAYLQLGSDLFALELLDEAEKAYQEAANLFSAVGTPSEQAFATHRLALLRQNLAFLNRLATY
ncbi:MAG: AfsR/SARP family transcriptional regulator [Aggregatilineales bacterium]